jgi:protein TonB
MKTKVNIFTSEWCNLVFEGKNKEYGAYELRQRSSKRHAIAILLSVSVFTLGVSAPVLLKRISPETKWKITEVTGISNIEEAKPEPMKPIEEIKLPEVRRTIQFTPPEVTNDDLDQAAAPVIDELISSNAAISTATVDGSDDADAPLPDFSIVEKEPDPIVFASQMPEFPGGDEARIEFLNNNLRYPSIATEMGISGRVTLQFVVEKDGHIDRIKVIRGLGGGCDEEALRVIKLMPKWKPGMQDGKCVPVYFTFPVVFALKE